MLSRVASLGLTGLLLGSSLVGSAVALPLKPIEPPIPQPIPTPFPIPTPIPTPPAARTMRIPATLLANVLESSLTGTKMKLHNYGPKHGSSWQLNNASYIQLPARLSSQTYRFSLPEVAKNLPWPLGHAKVYVNDVNLNRLNVDWSGSALQLQLSFEDSGREIIGKHTKTPESLIPDVQVDNGRATVKLTPIARDGKLSYRLLNRSDVDFTAKMQATGACKIPVVGKICDWLFDYKDRIINEVEGQGRSILNNNAIRGRIENALSDKLRTLGVNEVVSVQPSGNDIIVRYR